MGPTFTKTRCFFELYVDVVVLKTFEKEKLTFYYAPFGKTILITVTNFDKFE